MTALPSGAGGARPVLTDVEPAPCNFPDPVLRRIGLRVRDARGAAGLTQRELAEKSGVSRQTVGNVEGGLRESGILVFARIAGVLGVGVESLLRAGDLADEDGESR